MVVKFLCAPVLPLLFAALFHSWPEPGYEQSPRCSFLANKLPLGTALEVFYRTTSPTQQLSVSITWHANTNGKKGMGVWSSHTPLTWLLQCNQHAAASQVRKESTSPQHPLKIHPVHLQRQLLRKNLSSLQKTIIIFPYHQFTTMSSQSATQVIPTWISYVKTRIHPPRICPPFLVV